MIQFDKVNDRNFIFNHYNDYIAISSSTVEPKDASVCPEAEEDRPSDGNSPSIMSFVTEEHFIVEEYTQSIVVVEQKEIEEKQEDNEEAEQKLGSEGWAIFRADEVEIQLNLQQRVEKERKENAEQNDPDDADDAEAEQFFIGKSTLHGRRKVELSCLNIYL